MGDISDYILLAGGLIATLWYFARRNNNDSKRNEVIQDSQQKMSESDEEHHCLNKSIESSDDEGTRTAAKIAPIPERKQLSKEEYFQKADNLIHSSTPVLRSLFRERWKHTTGAPWRESSSLELISGIGKDAYLKAKLIQKRYLKTGNVEQWDISLLGLLLRHSKWDRSCDDESKWKKENHAVEKLLQLRNTAAHAPVKQLSGENYGAMESLFWTAMRALNVDENEIQILIDNAGEMTPVSGWSAASKIFEKGKEMHQSGKYQEAINLFGDALRVPGLLNSYQAILLENRAASHLKLAEDMSRGCRSEREAILEDAMNDVKKCLEFNDNSWEAHFIIGKIYKHKNDLNTAEEHLRKALALSPGQTCVKTELECCKLLLGKIRRAEHLDPMNHPMTFQERVEHFTNETGKPMTKELWLKVGDALEITIPGSSHVHQGHRHFAGWGVKQDYLQASMCYAKADKLGNAEGTYNLAQLYMNGNGVEQCIPRGIQLLEKAASMPSDLKSGRKDIGVLAAQHAMGLAYDEGVHFPQNPKEAAKWYKKAADNGMGKAANNLGCLYYNGRGVDKDVEKAVMYFKLAVKEKDMNAAYSLSLHYRKEMEPELARIMFDRAVEFGNDHLSMIRSQYFDDLAEVEKLREELEPHVVAYEKEHNLSAAGMTFHQRFLRRMRGDTVGAYSILADSIETREEIANLKGSNKWPGKVNGFDPDDLEKRAIEGSITAQRIIQVLQGSFEFDKGVK